jgi:hypothetical protein
MATTVQQVFDITMALTDNNAGGAADSGDTADYKARTIPIVNSLSVALYQFSADKNVTAGARPLPVFVTMVSDAVDLDDGLARGVLPHGLAAALLAEENPAMAGYHAQRYAECLALLRNAPREFEPITDVYGEKHGDGSPAFWQ